MLIIGIVIVNSTSPKHSNKICQRTFKSATQTPDKFTSAPRSIAIGNLNNDTVLDIVVANSATNNVAIFLGYENGTFAHKKLYSTGTESSPYSVAIGDFNNDNQSDIVVANFGTHNVGLLLGQGDGTFTSQISFFTGSSKPRSLALGDLNGDDCIDVVVANDGTNDISIFIGYCNGSLQLLMHYSTEFDSHPYFVLLAELNNDDRLDIAVANTETNNVGIFLGYGNGTFSAQKIFTTGNHSNPTAIGIGDFNHDNQLDLVVTNSGTSQIILMLGHGDGSFKPPASIGFDPDTNPQYIVAADFNHDKQLDIIVANQNDDSISIFMGYKNQKFSAPIKYSTGVASSPISIVVADFNRDEQLDVATVNVFSNTIGILIANWIEPGAGRSTSLLYECCSIAIADGDFNNDTQLDIAVANFNRSTIEILLGNGDGTFNSLTTYYIGTNVNPQFIIVKDLNHDGLLDIIIAAHGTDNIGIILALGNNIFSNEVIYLSTGTDSNPSSIAINDLNNDKQLDIVVANRGNNNVGVLLGYDNTDFGKQTTYFMGSQSQPMSVAIGDFNNDNRLDIAVALSLADAVGILLGKGDGTFQTPIIYSTEKASSPVRLALADFNMDNNLDIVVVTQGTYSIGVLLGYGNSSFAILEHYFTGLNSAPNDIKINDFNNDSILDIAVANYLSNSVGIFLGLSNGKFGSQSILPINSPYPVSITVGDFNQDGWIDICALNAISNNVEVLLGNFYNSYQNVVFYSTGSGSHPYFVTVANLSSDKYLDLVVSNSLGDNIAVYHGYENGSFVSEVIYSTGVNSLPSSIAIADVNNDNQSDIIFTNGNPISVGLLLGFSNGTFGEMMTFSIGLQVSPISVAVDDLNRDGRLDIVVAQQTADSLGIFFGDNYTNFPNLNVYPTGFRSRPNSVAIGNLNNDKYSDIIVANLQSGNICIFLGYGNGSFTTPMTYSTGNGSNPSSVDLGDFNNDTHLDVALLDQNMDHIVILLGDGNGSFVNMTTLFTSNSSQLQHLIIIDFNNDSRLDIAVTDSGTNNVRVFFGYGDGLFSSQNIFNSEHGTSPHGIVATDFNEDGYMDIGVTLLKADSVGIFLGYGDGNFRDLVKYSTGKETSSLYSIAVGDFNHDTYVDIVAADYDRSKICILLGHGDGTFGNVSTYSTGIDSLPRSIAVGDFNNDDRLDILVANVASWNVGIFYGYGNGKFASVSTYPIEDGSFAVSVAISDLNNDNKLDIVLANFGTNSVGVLLASGSKPFSSLMDLSTGKGSLPTDITIGDFNRDNFKDITVANYGTNSVGILLGNGNRTFENIVVYTTENSLKPTSIAVDDLNQDNCLDIAVTNSYSNNVGILIGNCDGTFQKQVLYSTGDGSGPFSHVLSDFNNDNITDIATANIGTNTICILLGHGNGTFDKQKTYSIGYGSRPVSISAGDFDNDGWTDIVVANADADNLVILLNFC